MNPGGMRPQNRHLIPGIGRKKKGDKDKVPRSAKASIVRAFQEVYNAQPELYHEAVIRGIQAKPPISFAYLQLAAHYLDGKPADTVKHTGDDDAPPMRFSLRIREPGGNGHGGA